MATANELTHLAVAEMHKGRRALWLSMRAVYVGGREFGYGRLRSTWCALVLFVQIV